MTDYAGSVREAIEKYSGPKENLAAYFHKADRAAVSDKVIGIVPSVEVVGDELMGCATVTLREALDEAETAALCAYLTGQYSDSWGEGFE